MISSCFINNSYLLLFNQCFLLRYFQSGDEEEGEDEDEGRATKRRRLAEEEILKRREKRLWRQNRDALLFEYSKFTYYTKAVSLPSLIHHFFYNFFLPFRVQF